MIARNSRNGYMVSQHILKLAPSAKRKTVLSTTTYGTIKYGVPEKAEQNGSGNGKWHKSALIQLFCMRFSPLSSKFRGAGAGIA